MSQNKKKFFGKRKNEQELEQTQTLPPMPENNSDKTVQTEENTAPEEASEKADADEKNEKAEQLARSFCKRFNRSKCVRVIIAAGLIILLVGGSVFAVIRSRNTGTEDTIPTTAVVTYGDIGTYIEGSGETAARNTEELGLGIEGKISQVLVSEGDEVHAGDPLVVVDPTGIREQLTAAQAEFTAAQSELTNAQAAITQAQSRIASAQSQYTHGSATAPFSGKFIASSTFAAGQKVSAGQTIGRMVNDSQMQLAVQFSSEYAKDIKAGQTATISTSVGQVSAVVSSIDSASGKGTFLVVLTVQNPSGALAQGTSATATINSDSAGTIFSSGSGTLDYIKEQVITAPIGGEITAYNGSKPHIQQRCSHYVDLQCCSAGYFGRAKQSHGCTEHGCSRTGQGERDSDAHSKAAAGDSGCHDDGFDRRRCHLTERGRRGGDRWYRASGCCFQPKRYRCYGRADDR